MIEVGEAHELSLVEDLVEVHMLDSKRLTMSMKTLSLEVVQVTKGIILSIKLYGLTHVLYS